MCASREMPKYKCHKVVRALKLKSIEVNNDCECVLTPEDSDAFEPLVRDLKYANKQPQECRDDPGYFVVYEDGYESWSPTKAFEDGYTRLP